MSAERKNGKTEFIRIRSLAGEPCRVKTDMIDLQCFSAARVAVRSVGNSTYEIDLKKGEEIVLAPKGSVPVLRIAPLVQENSYSGYGATLPLALDKKLLASVDWPEEIGALDQHWNELPSDPASGPVLGNGTVAARVFQASPRTLRWNVYHAEAQAEEERSNLKLSQSKPVGYYELTTTGNITGGSFTLDLWNAELTGNIQTDKGALKLRSLVTSYFRSIVAEVEGTEQEKDFTWKWVSATAATQSLAQGVDYSLQPRPGGAEVVTAWSEDRRGGKSALYVSMACTDYGRHAKAEAIGGINNLKARLRRIDNRHQKWWHSHYQRGWLALSTADQKADYWPKRYTDGVEHYGDRKLGTAEPFIQTRPTAK